MNLLIVLGALIFLMFVAYRGYSVILFAPIAALGAVLLTDPIAGPTRVFQRLHGEDGRLREELFPGFHAGRRLRQSHRAVGLFQVDRIRRHRRARPGARRTVHCRRLRDPDLRWRVAVRRGVRGLSVRGRDVSPGRYSKAAHPLHDRARGLQLHDGCLAGNAANSEHHSDDVLQHDDVGRSGAGAGRQHFRFRRRSCSTSRTAAVRRTSPGKATARSF